jgi:HlyD family secretion protein
MRAFIHRHHFYFGLIILVMCVVGVVLFKISTQKPPERITAIVDSGPVRQLVSVSGIADAKQSADLAFPVSGTIDSITVHVGDVVKTGDVLAQLDAQALDSDRQDALAALRSAQANREELLSGPQKESREVTAETFHLKEEALITTEKTAENNLRNARRTLLSSGLSAYSNDDAEDAVAPIVSGTYTCETEGTYIVDVYSSGTASGYSFRLSGLETGTYVASVDQAIAFGVCGLRIVFDKNSMYGKTRWFIEIPNTKSANYTANVNAYNAAQTDAKTAISLAEHEVALAKATAENSNAPARSEAIARADASVAQAEARLGRIDAEIADHVLKAPFDGTITDIHNTVGETTGTEPIMTLLSGNDFVIKARVPEIDIGKLQIGQKVDMVFDAKSDVVVHGVINFISLQATLIDGVSYYEAYIKADTVETWMRNGLNADIDIIFAETEHALRIPKRFISTDAQGTFTLKKIGENIVHTPTTVTLDGNDGFVAITGLNEGDTIVAP